MNKTLEYYKKNAEIFIAGTINVILTDHQDKFLSYLPAEGKILDFGCGAGRDTKYFLSKGYDVEAIDGSKELCQYATNYTGIEVQHQLFQELNAVNEYDGIWACASILHLSKAELRLVFEKIYQALKNNGILYTSFKYGDFSGERHGRFFTDMNESSFATFLQGTNFSIKESWISNDARPDRKNEKWLNLILQKK